MEVDIFGDLPQGGGVVRSELNILCSRWVGGGGVIVFRHMEGVIIQFS